MGYLTSKIPISLIYSRLFIGFLLVGLSFFQVPYYGLVAVVLLIVAVLTDVLDGVLARRLGVSTQRLRRLDSSIDQIFWLLVVLSSYVAFPAFFMEYGRQLKLLLALEALTYIACFLKFKKEVATHTFAAKAWVLVMLATLVQLCLSGHSGWLFQLCFYVGILSRLEIIAIIVAMNTWASDVPTLYHAMLLRRGKNIRRHKLFHG
jgi:phosphatidylglycerophosphate synthase